jgi:hypothetical protein
MARRALRTGRATRTVGRLGSRVGSIVALSAHSLRVMWSAPGPLSYAHRALALVAAGIDNPAS